MSIRQSVVAELTYDRRIRRRYQRHTCSICCRSRWLKAITCSALPHASSRSRLGGDPDRAANHSCEAVLAAPYDVDLERQDHRAAPGDQRPARTRRAPNNVLRVQFDDLAGLEELAEPILRIVDWYEHTVLGHTLNEVAHAGGRTYRFCTARLTGRRPRSSRGRWCSAPAGQRARRGARGGCPSRTRRGSR